LGEKQSESLALGTLVFIPPPCDRKPKVFFPPPSTDYTLPGFAHRSGDKTHFLRAGPILDPATISPLVRPKVCLRPSVAQRNHVIPQRCFSPNRPFPLSTDSPQPILPSPQTRETASPVSASPTLRFLLPATVLVLNICCWQSSRRGFPPFRPLVERWKIRFFLSLWTTAVSSRSPWLLCTQPPPKRCSAYALLVPLFLLRTCALSCAPQS